MLEPIFIYREIPVILHVSTLNRVVNSKTSILFKQGQIYKRWFENESKPIINFRCLRILSKSSAVEHSTFGEKISNENRAKIL